MVSAVTFQQFIDKLLELQAAVQLGGGKAESTNDMQKEK